jgi:secondary thiamine-phosphate synthase enzyme
MSVSKLTINVIGQGLYPITREIGQLLQPLRADTGICNLFLQHTSASLLIQENYDPSAKADLENWLNRLVPENDPLFTHTLEGPDDMPAHIKAALTATCLSIPILGGKLGLGTWQGIFLWEHRHYHGPRQLLVHIGS